MNSQSGFFIMSVCALITNSGTLGYIVRSVRIPIQHKVGVYVGRYRRFQVGQHLKNLF